MPNHIKNRLTFSGDTEKINALIDAFTTHYPAELHMTDNIFHEAGHTPSIICRSNDGGVGWLNPSTGVFSLRNEVDIIGLPEGYSIEINQAWDRFPDFNKVIPMPVEVEATFGESGLNPAWYRWSIDNWGTKWNSYDCEKIAWNVYEFDTAWSNVANLIGEIHEQFPEVGIVYEWADEDTGSNTGMAVFTFGNAKVHIPKNDSIEAYEMAFRLRPENKDYYELVDGEYKYKED